MNNVVKKKWEGSLPVVWQGDVLSGFEDYLAQAAVRHPRGNPGNPLGQAAEDDAQWRLFRLAQTAHAARMVASFDELLALHHIQGFTPLPHQLKTAERVLRELRGRAILADEVGLGKTIEAGLVLKEYMLRGLVRKALILVPASLVLQWTRELNQKFRIPAAAQKNEWTWEQYDIIVASLDTAKREPHRSHVLGTQWDLLLVDEAHKLKNNKTKNWQMVNQVPNKFMLLLTATPMQNNLNELHTLITLLRPGQLGSRREFAAEHMVTQRVARDAGGLRDHLTDVMIRNRRRDGGSSLPDRHVSVVELDLSTKERHFYDAVQRFLREEYAVRKAAKASLLPLITLQREICSSPYAAMITLQKLQKRMMQTEDQLAIDELISLGQQIDVYSKVERVLEMIDESEEKCIIFTEYRATQDFIMYMLKKRGVTAVPFRGGFGRGKKDWMKDLFANRMRVLVATESGGEGINLQFCSRMINFDLPWNPMRLEQRIGRIHRLGQQRDVHIYNLSTRNTIEAHIVELLHEKIYMFEAVIGELDHILGSEKQKKSASKRMEERLFDMAMTIDDDEKLRKSVMAYGDEMLGELDAGRAQP